MTKSFYEQLSENGYYVSKLNENMCMDCKHSSKPELKHSSNKQCNYYKTAHKERNLVNMQGTCKNFKSK